MRLFFWFFSQPGSLLGVWTLSCYRCLPRGIPGPWKGPSVLSGGRWRSSGEQCLARTPTACSDLCTAAARQSHVSSAPGTVGPGASGAGLHGNGGGQGRACQVPGAWIAQEKTVLPGAAALLFSTQPSYIPTARFFSFLSPRNQG